MSTEGFGYLNPCIFGLLSVLSDPMISDECKDHPNLLNNRSEKDRYNNVKT